jgi:hypothetical protein
VDRSNLSNIEDPSTAYTSDDSQDISTVTNDLNPLTQHNKTLEFVTTLGTIHNTPISSRTPLESKIMSNVIIDSDGESISSATNSSNLATDSTNKSDTSSTSSTSSTNQSTKYTKYRKAERNSVFRKPKHQRSSHTDIVPNPTTTRYRSKIQKQHTFSTKRHIQEIRFNLNLTTEIPVEEVQTKMKQGHYSQETEEDRICMYDIIREEYKEERRFWASSKSPKSRRQLALRTQSRDSIFEHEYNPDYGDSYPSTNEIHVPNLIHPRCPDAPLRDQLRVWSLQLIQQAEQIEHTGRIVPQDREAQLQNKPQTNDLPPNPGLPLPPPQPPPIKPYEYTHTIPTPLGATEFIMREGTTFDLRGLSIDELVEAIMDCKENDGQEPPNIQIDIDQAKELEEYICDPNRLLILQTEEQAAQDIVDAELDIPCLNQLRLLCTDSLHELRPALFPEELWPFVDDTQKPLVKQRMSQFDQDFLTTSIYNLRKKLNINKSRPHCYKYYEAQAVANLDRYILVDENNPPMVSDEFMFPIDLKEGFVVDKCKPQTFTEIQKKFLTAKTHLMQMTDKIEPRNIKLNPEDWNSRLMLVEYKERIAASRTKWAEQGLDFLLEASKATNYAEVSTWFRLTIDLRTLNAATVPEPFPMPSTTIAKENCKESRFFCVSDLADAFFSVKLRPSDYGKTGFTTHDSQFVFKVMPQGAMNAARQFSRIATAAFEGVPLSVICPFQDDTLNHAKLLITSLTNQQLLYDCTRKAQLILKVSKTTLGYASAKFLGHIHSQHGRSPDPALVSAVLDIATPTEVTHVRHLLGLVQYNMEYIRGGMGIISCLSDLTLKGVNVEEAWNPETHGVALNEIKHALTTAPCLIPIDPRGKFTIHVDTCKKERGIGAVLLQWVEKSQSWRPCAYYSRKLVKGQKQWSATELEAMGMVFACIHWDKFIRNGLSFRVIVDHKALLWLVTRKTKTANGRIISWILQLQDYDFEILHRNGIDHLDADAISRLLHFDDIEGTYGMAKDMNVDDLSGPATGKDLRHLVQLYKLQQFMKQRSLTLLQKEVSLPPTLTEPLEINLQYITDTDNLKHRPLQHDKLLRTILESNDPVIDEEVFNMIENYLGEANLNQCNSDNHEDDIWIDEFYNLEDNTDEHLNINSLITENILKGNISINIPNNPKSVAKVKKQTTFTQELKDAQQTFQEKRTTALSLDQSKNKAKTKKKNLKQNEDIIDELIAPYQYLEGQCFIDPRNQRMYEVIMITYDEELEVIAAFRQVTDDEPPDLTDNELILVEGKHGLAALVKAFTTQGGNQGDISNPWPSSDILMREAQLQDPVCANILSQLTDEVKEVVINRQTYFTNSPTSALRKLSFHNEDKNFSQIIIPSQLRINVLQFYHNDKGHPGAQRTADTIVMKYWWPNFRDEVKDHISQCKFCLRRKPAAGGKIPIQEYTGPDYPWERSHMDLTGPFPMTKAGNQYILVVKCALTRYAEIIAIPNKEARTVAQALVKEIYLRHGSIGTLISDRGTEFTNEIMKNVSIILKVKRISTTPANPRSNGLAENHMRLMKDSLASFCNARQDDWDLWIGVVGYGYATTVNSATGYTPFYMLYGREASTPSQDWVQSIAKITCTDKYITDLVDRLQYVWTTVGNLKPKQVQTMNDSAHPRKHIIQLEYKEGSFCYLKRVPKRDYTDWRDKLKYKISSKLQTRYTGPYKILRQLSPVLYVANVDGKEKTIHAINMKRTPDVRLISQANVDAARRMDFNRIHGPRAGGQEDRVLPALLLPEERNRRNLREDMNRARNQSSDEKSAIRKNRMSKLKIRKEKTKQKRINERLLKAILSPQITVPKTQEIIPIIHTNSSSQLAPESTHTRQTSVNEINSAGHKEKGGIMLTKTPPQSEVTNMTEEMSGTPCATVIGRDHHDPPQVNASSNSKTPNKRRKEAKTPSAKTVPLKDSNPKVAKDLKVNPTEEISPTVHNTRRYNTRDKKGKSKTVEK